MNANLFSIFTFNYPKGYEFKNFSYARHELIYMISGEGILTIDENNYTYKSHQICFSKANEIKDLRCTKSTDYICIRFIGDIDNVGLNSGVYPANSDILFNLFQKIKDEYIKKRYNYLSYCNLLIEEILVLLSRNAHANDKTNTSINHLIQEIDTNPCFSKDVMEMAKITGYSYDHFRHKFKKITGIPPADYILNKRIENACLLLKEGKLSCSEISEFCGFASPSQFSVLFKRKTGILPKQYLSVFNHLN